MLRYDSMPERRSAKCRLSRLLRHPKSETDHGYSEEGSVSAAVPLRFEVPQFPLQDYLVRDWDALLTPALVIYPDVVDRNIDSTLKLVGGDTTRWRPHVKTAKLEFVTRRLVERGVTQMKCATTLEL